MISVILYGRNDNYGYNLHKRAALSLNCIAETLTDPDDEILFVDYNTPDDFPTFPEAIQDTLTKRARKMLRIFRARSRLHERYRTQTHLYVLEPIARNIAVRRSSSANRWILSTNTDMIFLPRRGASLSEVVKDLASGFFHAPRIEIPELLWEGFNRQDPIGTIATIRQWGRDLHLDEISAQKSFIRYENPGDFQLLLRDDLFEIQGFHEQMLLGWHVDSNIARRMALKYGSTGDLGDEVYGYHCDHTRQVTTMHSHGRLQNDWHRFCVDVESPSIPTQETTWGCPVEPIEEIRLLSDPAQAYLPAIREAVGAAATAARVVTFAAETFNTTDYDPPHLMPFLADIFATVPRNSNVAWCGANIDVLSRFASLWKGLGFTGKIRVEPNMIEPASLPVAIAAVAGMSAYDGIDTFVFDFGRLPPPPESRDENRVENQLKRKFIDVVREERRRLSDGLPPRRVIALNAVNNKYELFVMRFLAAAATPTPSYMRHGYVLPVASENWLPLLNVGEAGERNGANVESNKGITGLLAFTRPKYLEPGLYRLKARFQMTDVDRARLQNEPCAFLEILSNEFCVGTYTFVGTELDKQELAVVFDVPAAVEPIALVKMRISLLARVAVVIHEFVVESAPAEAVLNTQPLDGLKFVNWLPMLYLDSAGQRDSLGVKLKPRAEGYAVYGPYWPLPQGHYIAIVEFGGVEGQLQPAHIGTVEVLTGNNQLVTEALNGPASIFSLRFDIRDPQSRPIEIRLWNPGTHTYYLKSVSVKSLSETKEWLPYLSLGSCGLFRQGRMHSRLGQEGHVCFGPYWSLPDGQYELAVTIGAVGPLTKDAAGGPIGQAQRTEEPQTRLGTIDVFNGTRELVSAAIDETGKVRALFSISSADQSAPIETRISTSGVTEFLVESVCVEPRSASEIGEWLPYLSRGSCGLLQHGRVRSRLGQRGNVCFGPYWPLPTGQYKLTVTIRPVERRALSTVVRFLIGIAANWNKKSTEEPKTSLGKIDVFDGTRELASAEIHERDPLATLLRRPIEVCVFFSTSNADQGTPIETRIWTSGAIEFFVDSVEVALTELRSVSGTAS